MEFQHELIIPSEGLPFKVFLFEGGKGNYEREKHWHTSIEIFSVLDGSLSMAAYPASATPENFVCCSEIVFNSDLIASELKNFLFSEDSHSILAFTEYNYSISSNPDIFDSFSDSRPMDTHPVKLKSNI